MTTDNENRTPRSLPTPQDLHRQLQPHVATRDDRAHSITGSIRRPNPSPCPRPRPAFLCQLRAEAPFATALLGRAGRQPPLPRHGDTLPLRVPPAVVDSAQAEPDCYILEVTGRF